MKYCPNCLQPDTRPNTVFTPEGICPACDYWARLANVDWQERYEILKDLLAQYPRRPGQHHQRQHLRGRVSARSVRSATCPSNRERSMRSWICFAIA